MFGGGIWRTQRLTTYVLQQLLKHVEQDVCFARIAWTANQHPENIRGHAGVPLPVVGGRFPEGGVVIRNFHSAI